MELTVDQALQKAVEAHKARQIQEADRLYTAILQAQPKHPDANHNMGVLAVSVGKVRESLPFFKTALGANPKIEQFWLSYIDALSKLERMVDAQSVLDQAKGMGIKGKVLDQLEQKLNVPNEVSIDPPQDQLNRLINLYQQGQPQQTLDNAKQLLSQFPDSFILYNLCGAANAGLGNFGAAIGSYQKALKIKPDYAEAYNNMGTALKNKGDLEAAIDSYQQALKIKPDYVEVYCNIGNALHGKNDLEAAIDNYRRALKIKPDYAEAYNNMGIALLGKGDLNAAIDSYKQALKIKPDYADAYYNMGNTLNYKGDLEAAIEGYKHAIKIKPDYASAFNNMGAALKDKGDLEAAIKSYQQALKIKPDYAEAYNNMGVTLKDKGDLDAAIDSYKQALRIKPGYADAYNNMGVALQGKGDLNAAIDSYKKALKIKPDYAEAYYNMGNTLNDKGDLDAAIDSYKHAIKIKPDYASAFNNMGAALKDKGDLEAAIKSYQQALKIKPDYAEAYNNMGVTLKDKGDLDAAIDSYKQALRIKPGYADAYNNMGVALQGKGDLNAAIDSYKKALKIKPDYAEAYYNMGNTLNDKGDLEAAIESYKYAIKIKPDYADAFNNMGNALNEKGDLEAAIKSYQQALKIKPDYTEVWNNLTFPLQTIKLQVPSIEKLLPTISPKAGYKYAQIAKSVLIFILNRGGKNTESALNEVYKLLSKADNRIIKNPEVTTKKPLPQIIRPNKIVALVHFGRSGTGLLHSLIDGHPEVSTMPSIYFSEFFNHSTWDRIVLDGWSKMADRFIATYEVLFDASVQNPVESKSSKFIEYVGQMDGMTNIGDQRDEVLRVDKTLFWAELHRLMGLHDYIDACGFFALVHAAYDKVLNDLNHKHLIFYHIHNPSRHTTLNFVHAAPNTNWVMMVREPIQACESWVRSNFRNNEHTDIATKIITMLFEIDNIIYHKQRSVGVRLEDLKEFPRKTIPALCDWMGIEETEGLYEMTAQGKKWWGDPISPDYAKDGMKPFGKTSIRRKVGSVFTDNDQFILRTLFYPFSVRFGYAKESLEQFKADLQTIRPILGEMFGFEKMMAERAQLDIEQFMKSGSYLYLRSGLIERWNVLAEFNTYPNMIEPLDIS